MLNSPDSILRKKEDFIDTMADIHRFVLLMFLVVIFGQKCAKSANMGCKEVKYKFERSAKMSKDGYESLLVPESESAVQICPKGPSCCTPDMELRMRHQSSLEYREAVNNKTTVMANPFHTKASKLHEFIEKLFDDSQEQFHGIFKKTYGPLYEKNARIFRDYFEALRKYFYRGRVNLNEATKSFFATLYQKMFQVMNSQYTFDKTYLLCVAQHMDQILPFGEVPQKMASSVKKTFLSSRAMYKAVQSAFDIADKMKSLEPTKECLTAVQKMNSCPACQGFQDIRPCSNYCINVMKGCLVFHIELQNTWDEFIDALALLGERLQGPHNLEMILLSSNSPNLPIQISDAIMTFQGSGLQVTEKIFAKCGKPRTVSKRDTYTSGLTGHGNSNSDIETEINSNYQDQIPEEAKTSALISSSSTDQRDLVKSNMHRSEFKRLIKEISNLGKDSQGFWKHLPYVMCDQPVNRFQEKYFGTSETLKQSDNNQCWNGKNSGPYSSGIVEDGLDHLLQNPEFQLRSTLLEPSLLKQQTDELRHITLQLKSAHTGLDVEWWNERTMAVNDQEDSDFEGSGDTGSGYGDSDNDYETGSGNRCGYVGDDEDYNDEGSGDCPPDSTTTTSTESPWTPWKPATTTSTTTTTTKKPPTTTTQKSRTIITAGVSNPTVSSNVFVMSLSLTVALYWLVL